MRRLIMIGDATSQWLNTALFAGEPNESISGRAHRENRPWKKWINWAFLWLDPDGKHCQTALENDVRYARELVEWYDNKYREVME